MAYQIKCDSSILYDPRDKDLVVLQPRCKLEVNTVGEASFTILANHPYYNKLKKLKSVFEIKQNGETIFRGRMTTDSKDFYNQTAVDLEGILACTNDTMVPPFNFPNDFAGATESENIVRFFLEWILAQHNEHAEPWQQLQLGNVTVSDPNNYITRESKEYASTWDTLRSKLFESELGGYLCIRYEDDGNYVDYLSEFELTNTQRIRLTENLLDLTNQTDASETYSAILPLGKQKTGVGGEKRLTIAELPDGDLTDDIAKDGLYIYSKSAVEQYGWICVPVADATWDDVTVADNLQTKAMEYLTGKAMLLSSTISIKAVDLAFTSDEIQSFRIYRNILVDSPAHDLTETPYPLTMLDIDILNPQNTVIVIGETARTLVAINSEVQTNTIERIDQQAIQAEEIGQTVTEEVKQQMTTQETSITATCSAMILAALENYVETGEYSDFKETVETQLEILASEITMHFTTTTESIENVDGDLQAKFNQLYKYITFSSDGIVIGSGENAITLEIDNDMIAFKKNGLQFGWWDGVDFHTGNIVVDVNERAQFGNFAFIPRSDGSLMFLKVR